MSTASVPVPITVEEFLRRPERHDGLQEELLHGEVIVSPNAKPTHSYATSRVFIALLPLEASGLYLVLGEVACRLSDDSLPNTDACVYSRDVYQQAMNADRYPAVSPLLAVEVASPGNRRLHTKAELYLEHGAEQVWLVYPKTRRVRVLTPEDDYDVRPGETLQFKHLAIAVDALFA